MKMGLQIPSFTWPGGAEQIAPNLARIGRAAEESGFSSLWVMDHFFQIETIGNPDEPMLEAYGTLNFLAAHTNSIQLGVPFPPLKERFERLEETVQIALQMWLGKSVLYMGKHYRLAETLCSPLPISKPHPPIMIGGAGEKRTLPLVAKYADACNLYAFEDAAVLRRKLDVLRRHCDAIGRRFEEIERTAIGAIDLRQGGMSTREAIEYCRKVSGSGIQHFIVSMPGDYELKPLERMEKEIIPAVVEF